MSIIVGIDPGSRVTGFGIIEQGSEFKETSLRSLSYGVIDLDEKADFPTRTKELGQSLEKLFAQFRPKTVVIEKIFLGRNADSAFKLGHARGVVMYQAACFNCEVFEYATRVVKKGITGKGSSSKDEVQVLVARQLGLKKIQRLDASDALALAFYHASRARLMQKMRLQEIEL